MPFYSPYGEVGHNENFFDQFHFILLQPEGTRQPCVDCHNACVKHYQQDLLFLLSMLHKGCLCVCCISMVAVKCIRLRLYLPRYPDIRMSEIRISSGC